MVSRGQGFGRGRGKRRERSRVLIVTEGQKTEVQYLEGLAQHLRASGAYVRAVRTRGVGKDPRRVVDVAIEAKSSKTEDFDEIWVVVDVDAHASRPAAFTSARKASIPIVVSNPCFEIWLLWHYEDCSAHQRADRIASRLKKYGHSGKSVPGQFPYGEVKSAVRRATAAPVGHSTVGPNPSSAMPLLVAALQRGS